MVLRKLAVVSADLVAVAALDLLLEATDGLDVARALVVESATYSALQGGPDHQAWLRTHSRKDRGPEGEPLRMARHEATLHITLDRPRVRNAYNAAMRDALLEALALAHDDDSIAGVVLDGAGPSFCSGGDLDEFGTTPDPATGHLIRIARSVGRALHEVRDKVTVVVHGPCVGAGVELAAFAGRVVARPDATFRLPEVAMGLVPGAGGTVSLPRRIGAKRTRWLAVSGVAIDADTALEWGLVDTISDESTVATGRT
jgi:enoyl-CoA hydratase/carnithine racemase